MAKRNGVEYEAILEHAAWLKELNKSGFLGCNEYGVLVDRRKHPDAVPVQKNSMFGIEEPKELPNGTKKGKRKEEKDQKTKRGRRSK